MFENAKLKNSIRQMRREVLIALLKKKGAKFLSVDIDQQMLLGKSDQEIYDHLISQQSLLFNLRERMTVILARFSKN